MKEYALCTLLLASHTLVLYAGLQRGGDNARARFERDLKVEIIWCEDHWEYTER